MAAVQKKLRRRVHPLKIVDLHIGKSVFVGYAVDQDTGQLRLPDHTEQRRIRRDAARDDALDELFLQKPDEFLAVHRVAPGIAEDHDVAALSGRILDAARQGAAEILVYGRDDKRDRLGLAALRLALRNTVAHPPGRFLHEALRFG